MANGKLRAPWIENVKADASPRRIEAVPLPWCTSQSITATRARPACACIARTAMAASLNTQKPSPRSRNAWCVPPARFADQPSTSASRAAQSVAPAERRERSTIAADQGKPIARTSLSVRVPSTTRAR